MASKMVIVMRHDLNMRKGKMVAQGSHAALGVIETLGGFTNDLNKQGGLRHRPLEDDTYLVIRLTPAAREWFAGSYKKVCLYGESEEELIELYEKARAAALPAEHITDSGLTEFSGVPTKTCIAIGPAIEEEIDKITGHLPLL
jgi:PTH2 family peptidyl-tRNA hydrolase